MLGNLGVDFPLDVMEIIIQHLSLRDRIRMTNVCKSWRRMLNNVMCHPQEVPWVLSSDLVPEHSSKSIRFYSMSDGGYIEIKLPDLITCASWDCCFSSNGWLVMAIDPNSKNHQLLLLDPLSGIMLSLPSFAKLPSFDEFVDEYNLWRSYGHPKTSMVNCMIEQIEVSVSPDDNTDSLIVAAKIAVSNNMERRIAICRPNDKEWTILHEDPCSILDAILLFYKGCLTVNRFIYKGHSSELPWKITTDRIISLTGNMNLKLRFKNIISPVYSRREWLALLSVVVSVDGELLVVVRHIHLCQDREERFDIYKYEDMEKLLSLGDQMLSLFGTSGSSRISSRIPGSLLQRNSIYFFSATDRITCVFNVEDKKIKPVNKGRKPEERLETLWFMPKCRTNLWSHI